MLSEEKISHLSHVLLKGLLESKLVEASDEEGKIRRQIKLSLTTFLKVGEDIEVVVKKKLQSFSRNITEGSPEWEVLYRKFFDEEAAKRGMAAK